MDTKKRWSKEEMCRLAALEVEGSRSGEMLTKFLPRHFPDRTAKSIKGVRRKQEYRYMVTLLLNSKQVVVNAEEPEESGADDALSSYLAGLDKRSSDRYDTGSLRSTVRPAE